MAQFEKIDINETGVGTMYFDPVYMLFAIPGLVLAGLATLYTKMTFSKYSEVPAASGMSGAEAAKRLLDVACVNDVSIEETEGFLSDHYDPSSKTLRLSPDVFGSNSLSAIGVACHEAGHAIQHAEKYAPLQMRSLMVPATNFASYGSYIFILLGSLMHSPGLFIFGAILFSVTVGFAIVTLPVEWDASARAKKMMVSAGIVSDEEAAGAGNVLNAAFMTYVASAVSSLLILIYYLMKSGLLGGRREE